MSQEIETFCEFLKKLSRLKGALEEVSSAFEKFKKIAQECGIPMSSFDHAIDQMDALRRQLELPFEALKNLQQAGDPNHVQ